MKHVPNNDKVAFKNMTPEERSAIVEAWLNDDINILGRDNKWHPANKNMLLPDQKYQTKPKQLVIPWEHLSPKIKFVFIGLSGHVYGCEYLPCVSGNYYDGWKSDGKWYHLECIKIDTDGIDWKDSLVQRPEGV